MDARPDQKKMTRRERSRMYTIALLAMVITLACSFTTHLFPKAAQTQTSQQPAQTKQSPVPVSGAPLGLIGYVGIDGNIYTIDQNGKQRTAITQDANLSPGSGQVGRVYQYPTWAPSGQRLAFIRFTGSSQANPQASLITASPDGKKRVEAFKSQDVAPFYLFWSPNSQYVSFLSNAAGGNDLALNLSAADGGDNQVLGTGQPFYWDWAPDNHTLIVHTGGAVSDNPDARLALYELDGSLKTKELDLRPGSFQAPAWSPHGDELILISQSDTGGEELVLAGKDGALKKVLAKLSGPVAFAWSPEGSRLAYTTAVKGDTTQTMRRLVLIDPAQPESSKDVTQGVVVAFFWSPDSRKIAYFRISQDTPSGASGNIQQVAQNNPRVSLEVLVYDLASETSKTVAQIQPTDSFQQVFPFFDQYQRSGTIWSPDSQKLVLAGFDRSGNPNIFVVSANGGPLQKIADGDLAFWSWK